MLKYEEELGTGPPQQTSHRHLKGTSDQTKIHQNNGLRKVLRAFRATPTRQLETEALVSPPGLWLNRRVARFQARLERIGIA